MKRGNTILCISAIILISFVMLGVSGCNTLEKGVSNVSNKSLIEKENQSKEQNISEAELLEIKGEECIKQGGRWLDIARACAMPTSDAGKICTDSHQCVGKCLSEPCYEERYPESCFTDEDINATIGKCSKWTSVIGCHRRIEDGKAQGICVL